MKAPRADQLKLLELQPIDTAIIQVKHRLAHSQFAAQIQTVDAEATKVDKLRVMTASAVKDIERKALSVLNDIDQAQARLTTQSERLESGKANHRELIVLEGEVKRLRERIDELQRMSEDLQVKADDMTAKHDKCVTLAQQLADKKRDIEAQQAQKMGEDQEKLAALEEKRQLLADQIDSDLLALYERIASQTGGTGVASIYQQHCPELGFDLSPMMWQRLCVAAEDDVITCDDNEYILVRVQEEA